MQTVFFLPGAGGSPMFWKPVADRLPSHWVKVHFGWPGLGDEPHDSNVNSFEDLVRLVEREIKGPVDLVAQSMGGVIAARVALAHPKSVRRLVLVVTSGGVDVVRFGASDWRPDYQMLFPRAANWILQNKIDEELPIKKITAPTLLIWGNADPISPVGVGRYLQEQIPSSTLHVLEGGDHDLASTMVDQTAELIRVHLS